MREQLVHSLQIFFETWLALIDLDLTKDTENTLLIFLYICYPRYRNDDLLRVSNKWLAVQG